MKALKPSHKEDKRYLLIEGENIKKNAMFAIKDYIGTLGISQSCPRWIDENVLSINRESLEKVRAAIVLSKEKISILKVSGTLKKLKD